MRNNNTQDLKEVRSSPLARLSIRSARERDWPRIWSILSPHVASGRSFIFQADLTEAEAKKIWVGEGQRIIVAIAEGLIVGTAKMGSNDVGACREVATATFAVTIAAQGAGIGRTLVNCALDWARQQGFRSMQFNAVFASNRRAIRLYRSLGFQIVAKRSGVPSNARGKSRTCYVMQSML